MISFLPQKVKLSRTKQNKKKKKIKEYFLSRTKRKEYIKTNTPKICVWSLSNIYEINKFSVICFIHVPCTSIVFTNMVHEEIIIYVEKKRYWATRIYFFFYFIPHPDFIFILYTHPFRQFSIENLLDWKVYIVYEDKNIYLSPDFFF